MQEDAIIEVARTIRQYCKDVGCDDCPFCVIEFDGTNNFPQNCYFADSGLIPKDWRFNGEEKELQCEEENSSEEEEFNPYEDYEETFHLTTSKD